MQKYLKRTGIVLVAVAFVYSALANPALGTVFHIGSLEIGAEQWRIFYLIYVIVMLCLFVASLLMPRLQRQKE